jgi:drug/metabolite transporter (DMT)-like permease
MTPSLGCRAEHETTSVAPLDASRAGAGETEDAPHRADSAPLRRLVPSDARTAANALETFAPELAQLVVVLLWSSTFVVAKAAFTEVPPLAFLFSRFVVMVALAFAVLLLRQKRGQRAVERRDWGLFVLAGLTGYTLYQLGFILGLSRTSAFSSSLLIAMVPLVTLLILALMREPAPRQGWVGLAVALTGGVIFLLDKRGETAGTFLGDLLSIGAAIAFAVYGIITRPLVRKYPAETYTAWSVLAGAVPLLAVSLPEAMRHDWAAVSLLAWLSIVYLAVFPVYIAYILWNWAIARRGVAKASSFGLLVPIVAGALSAFVLGEPFGPLKLLGAALVLAGLAIVRLPRLPPFAANRKGSRA